MHRVPESHALDYTFFHYFFSRLVDGRKVLGAAQAEE